MNKQVNRIFKKVRVKDATYTPDMFDGVSVKEVMEKNKYMRPDAIYYKGKRVDPKIVMNKPVSRIEVSSGIVYYYVKDAKVYDKVYSANDVEGCAKYLWSWDDSRADVARRLLGDCLNNFPNDMPAKEAYQKASIEAEKELKAFYSDLKSKVDSMVKSGYKKQLDVIKAFGKRG